MSKRQLLQLLLPTLPPGAPAVEAWSEAQCDQVIVAILARGCSRAPGPHWRN